MKKTKKEGALCPEECFYRDYCSVTDLFCRAEVEKENTSQLKEARVRKSLWVADLPEEEYATRKHPLN